MSEKESEILIIAETYIATQKSGFHKLIGKPMVSDTGDTWKVTYELPEDMIGGGPVVIIDKKSMKVVQFYRTQ